MSRVVRRRPAVLALAAGVALIAVLAVVLLGGSGDPVRPDFRIGDETTEAGDGARLMGDRRQARSRIYNPDTSDSMAIAERSGPGSTVLEFRTLVLDRDAKPVRIRQRTIEDLGGVNDDAPVRWQGYVAVQGDLATRTSVSSDVVGAWRPAGRDGVVVRPGQQVRLRTRYDLQPPRVRRTCRTAILLDGPRWQVREGDGPWEILRARDDEGLEDGEHRDVVVRTGQVGPLAFTARRPCGESGSTSGTYTGEGSRPADELRVGDF